MALKKTENKYIEHSSQVLIIQEGKQTCDSLTKNIVQGHSQHELGKQKKYTFE